MGLVFGQEFDVKLQSLGSEMPILCYNESRSFCLKISRELCDRWQDLLEVIQSFAAFEGKKVYLRATILEFGTLFLSSAQVFVKKW